MNAKRRNLDKLMTVLGRGAFVAISVAMVAAMSLGRPHNRHSQKPQKKIKYNTIVKKPVFPITLNKTTYFYYDTIRVDGDEYYHRNGWGHGAYNRYTNKARLKIIVDKSTKTSKAATKFINDFNASGNETAYHEIRHGMNIYYMGRVADVDSIMLTADEYWARVAGKIARHMNMAPPKKGDICVDVNYEIKESFTNPHIFYRPVYDARSMTIKIKYYAIFVEPSVRKMADTAIDGAIIDMTRFFCLYANGQFKFDGEKKADFDRSAVQNRRRALTYEQAMDSMSMFRINGRTVPITALASPEMQVRLDTFFNVFVPRELSRYQNGR